MTQKTLITLGNGQLSLMLGKAAKKLEIPFSALSLPEAWDWLKSGKLEGTLVTFEQEHVDEALVQAIEAAGIPAFPRWETFRLLKSKAQQKDFLTAQKIPTSPFIHAEPWTGACEAFLAEHKGAVLKAGRGGYDGKGVWIVNEKGRTAISETAPSLAGRIEQPYLEKRVAFERELAAVVCRSATGEIVSYPCVHSKQEHGICFAVEYTRELAATKVAKQACEIAAKIAQEIDYIGVLAVEFFELPRPAAIIAGGEDKLGPDGSLLVNEIAPRVHNSGHFTIDVCAGSQFENHIRAGLGMPLERTEPTHPAALMVNLLWPPSEKEFAPLFTKLTCGPAWPENVKLHWYGKSEARPRRKMGHFTVYADTLEECWRTADQVLATRWAKG